MSWQSANLALRVTAPVDVWVQTVDATSRAYDMAVLTAQGHQFVANEVDYAFVSIANDGADPIYCQFFSDGSHTLDDTVKVAAGGTPAYATTSCYIVPAGTERRFLVRRNADRFLYLKCAATKTSTARIYFSSEDTH